VQCHRAGFLRSSRLRGSPTADDDNKHRLLEIVCLNGTLEDATLVRELRKPFDLLAEGLLLKK
jgi:site-specific DNA recombinase